MTNSKSIKITTSKTLVVAFLLWMFILSWAVSLQLSAASSLKVNDRGNSTSCKSAPAGRPIVKNGSKILFTAGAVTAGIAGGNLATQANEALKTAASVEKIDEAIQQGKAIDGILVKDYPKIRTKLLEYVSEVKRLLNISDGLDIMRIAYRWEDLTKVALNYPKYSNELKRFVGLGGDIVVTGKTVTLKFNGEVVGVLDGTLQPSKLVATGESFGEIVIDGYKVVKNGDGLALIKLAEAGSLLTKLDNLGLAVLKKEVNLLDEATKTKFLDEFAGASDDALKALNSEPDLLNTWRKVGYLTDEAKDVIFLQALKKVETDDVWKHILGETYSSTSAAGGHYLTNISKIIDANGEIWIYSDKIRFKVSDILLPNPWSEGMEIMKAKKIKIFDDTQWVDKNGGGISSFFPSNWSKQRIIEETALAYKKAKANPNTYWDAVTNGNTYYVLASDGQTKITLFCGANGSINPLLNPTNNPLIKSSFPKF